MKERIEKIKAWAGEFPALAGIIVAGVVVGIYYFFIRSRQNIYEAASEIPYYPPVSAGYDGYSGDSNSTDDTTNYAELNQEMLSAYSQQQQEMLTDFAGVMQDMLVSFSDKFTNNVNKISNSPADYQTETAQQPFIPGSIIPQVDTDPYIVPDVPAMVFKIFDTPEEQKNTYGSIITGGDTGPYVAYGNKEVIEHFKSSPNTSVNPAGGTTSFVLDFRNRPQTESQKSYSQKVAEIRKGRSLEDSYRDLVNAGLLKGDPAAGEKQKAKRGVT